MRFAVVVEYVEDNHEGLSLLNQFFLNELPQGVNYHFHKVGIIPQTARMFEEALTTFCCSSPSRSYTLVESRFQTLR